MAVLHVDGRVLQRPGQRSVVAPFLVHKALRHRHLRRQELRRGAAGGAGGGQHKRLDVVGAVQPWPRHRLGQPHELPKARLRHAAEQSRQHDGPRHG